MEMVQQKRQTSENNSGIIDVEVISADGGSISHMRRIEETQVKLDAPV